MENQYEQPDRLVERPRRLDGVQDIRNSRYEGPFVPQRSGLYSIGRSNRRWNTIFLVTSPNVSSDVRFKENIKPLPYGLAEVEQIQPIKYTRKRSTTPQLGFSAQELKAILPEMVIDDGQQLSITPDALVPVLVNAIKELSARVQQLEDGVVQ